MTDFNAWAFPALAGTAAAALAGATAVRHRRMPGAHALLLLAVGVGWWCLLQVVSLHLPTVEAKRVAATVQYLGICTVPLAWFWFGTSYTGRDRQISAPLWTALILPELTFLLLAWTNDRHRLVWRRFDEARGGGAGMRIEHGPAFDLHVYYAYALIAVGTAVLIFHLIQAPDHRKRLAAVVLAPLFPLLFNSLYLSGLLPAGWIDLTPTGLAVGGIVMGWSLLRHDLLELPPVARSQILDAMRDAVLVLDRTRRVVDLNRAAARTLALRIGDTPDAALLDAAGGGEPHGVAKVSWGGRWFEARTTSGVRGVAGGEGVVLVIRDVTERHEMESELRRVSDELRRANHELERLANADPLLGIANRRRFHARLAEELARSRRYARPISAILLDVDHFKAINDGFGHAVGDDVLRTVARAIQEAVREVDTAARLGGDELAVLLPEADADGAGAVAERIRRHLAALSRPFPTGHPVTVSMGVATSVDGSAAPDDLLQRADRALYQAKTDGRNQIRTAAPDDAEVVAVVVR